jgi:hypothetical protein
MKIVKILPALILLMIITGSVVNGQCKSFARKTCLPELGSYTHDGNYHATVLSEGEEAELYKTFYSDMEYRMSVCGDENIPAVEFMVLDVNRNILFSSKDANNAKTWDFKLQSSQQLRIIIKVSSSGRQTGVPASGCVAIMFGFRIDS